MMRKLAIFFSFLFCFLCCQPKCHAQITVSDVQESFVKITGKVYYTVDGIYTKGGSYYLVITTDNRFDDPQFFQIGANKSEALESLKSILSLFGRLGDNDTTQLTDPYGKQCDVFKQKGIGSSLEFYFEKCAGKGHLNKKVLTTYIKIVDKHQ